MTERNKDLRDCPTAFECRDRLPELAAWMSDDELKQVRIWKGTYFEQNRMYFDLDNPDRGAFVATGGERPPTDHTYACKDEVPDDVWVKLATWHQPVSENQAQALETQAEIFGVHEEPRRRRGPGERAA
jgi:hypothetical protein